MNKFQQQRLERLRESLEKDTYTVDGILYWVSNRRIVPIHVFSDAGVVAPPGQGAAYRKETDEFLKRYREQRRNYKPSAEQMFEMRAAFGPGETVVDIITGQEFRT